MIIDAHVHLPLEKDCRNLCRKREKLFQELERNHIDRCIVISDSCMKSDIGNLNECVELFRESDNVDVVGGISPYFEFQTQLKKIRDYQEEHIQFVKNLKLNKMLAESIFEGNAKYLFRLKTLLTYQND